MRKKLSALLILGLALISMLVTPTVIADVYDDYDYIDKLGKEDSIWTGTFTGTSYDVFLVEVYQPEGTVVQVDLPYGVIFFEGTVDGKDGTLRISFAPGVKSGDPLEWSGEWEIISGTGELATLSGQGTWWGPSGDLEYSGEITFDTEAITASGTWKYTPGIIKTWEYGTEYDDDDEIRCGIQIILNDSPPPSWLGTIEGYFEGDFNITLIDAYFDYEPFEVYWEEWVIAPDDGGTITILQSGVWSFETFVFQSAGPVVNATAEWEHLIGKTMYVRGQTNDPFQDDPVIGEGEMWIHSDYDVFATLEEANTMISSLETQLSSANSEITGLESQLSSANSEITGLESQLSSANSEITGLESQLSSANLEITGLESQVASSLSYTIAGIIAVVVAILGYLAGKRI